MSKIDLFCKNPLPTTKGGLYVKELKEALKLKGLPATGTRIELIQRLCDATKKQKQDTQKKQKPEELAKWKGKKYEDVILDYDPTRRVVYLSGELLKDFSNMVKSNVEHGGFIDFNKTGNVDRTLFGLGLDGEINIKDVMDFEVQFHTHPVGRTIMGMYEIPSPDDVGVSMYRVRGPRPRTALPKSGQVHIVFAPDAVYTIYALDTDMKGLARLGVFNDPSEKRDVLDIYKKFKRAVKELEKNPDGIGLSIDAVNEYIELCRQYGVYIHRHAKFDSLVVIDHDEPINNWPKKIPLYLDPQEPVINITQRGFRQYKQQKA
jgi:hypothetical protein